MLHNNDIIITGLQPWNFSLGSNLANIARTLAKRNRVLFVNYAYDRLTLIKKRDDPKVREFIRLKRKGELQLEEKEDNLWVFTPGKVLESINQIGPEVIFNLLNKINGQRFNNQIKKAIEHLKFKNYILFTDSDFYRSFFLPEAIRPSHFIYYIRDNMVATNYFRKHGLRMESAMIRKADAVVTNSEFLAAYARKSNPLSYFVGQGCDLALFNKSSVHSLPETITSLKDKFKAIVGYIGALKSTRIDIELIIFLAEKLPDLGFLLVGPEDDVFIKNDRIHHLPNVIFAGSKKESELPSWLDFFDVAINPQLINEITIGNYPRKIDEYLALGKPVVATKTPAMEYFKNHVYLANSNEDYIPLIRRAITENTIEIEEERMRLAQTHSWEKNIEEIWKVLDGLSPAPIVT